jgi:hypothetical protein
MPRTIQSPDECRDGFEGVLACELLHIEPNARPPPGKADRG